MEMRFPPLKINKYKKGMRFPDQAIGHMNQTRFGEGIRTSLENPAAANVKQYHHARAHILRTPQSPPSKHTCAHNTLARAHIYTYVCEYTRTSNSCAWPFRGPAHPNRIVFWCIVSEQAKHDVAPSLWSYYKNGVFL